MRNIFIILLALIFPLLVFSQTKDNRKIASAIKVLKIHQSSLSTLSPFEEDEFRQIVRLNRKVTEKLLEMLHQQDILNFDKESIPFFACEATDKNFAVFNWQENLGGTFQQYANIFYWKNSKGNPQAWAARDEYTPFSKVFSLKNKKGKPLFLLIGDGIGCQTCVYEKALLIKTNKFDIEEVFSFEINYRMNSDIKGLSFDEKTNILSYEYLDDECEEAGEEGIDCWVRGQFKFNGKTFKEVEK